MNLFFCILLLWLQINDKLHVVYLSLPLCRGILSMNWCYSPVKVISLWLSFWMWSVKTVSISRQHYEWKVSQLPILCALIETLSICMTLFDLHHLISFSNKSAIWATLQDLKWLYANDNVGYWDSDYLSRFPHSLLSDSGE